MWHTVVCSPGSNYLGEIDVYRVYWDKFVKLQTNKIQIIGYRAC